MHEGWLEPLLDRIARDAHNVVTPVIDVINDETLAYEYSESHLSVGGFDWNLQVLFLISLFRLYFNFPSTLLGHLIIIHAFIFQFNWHSVPEKEKKRHNNTAEAVASPTMAGGLFSIDRKFFEKLGTYDSGFDIWGGENLELSFKVSV